MRFRSAAGWLFAIGIAVLHAQPYIPPSAILNDASLVPPGLPGGGIARGSRFAITGTGLGPASPLEQKSFPLGATLGGVTVTAVTGGISYVCWPLYVSATLVKAILPSNVPVGLAAIAVTFNGV